MIGLNSMISYDASVIGKRIRDIRKKNGYSQTKLSEQLMLSVDSVSNIENGKTTCMPEHIMRLCQIFNVSADYFYFGVNNKNEDVEIDIYEVLEQCHEAEKEKIRKIAMVLLDINCI